MEIYRAMQDFDSSWHILNDADEKVVRGDYNEETTKDLAAALNIGAQARNQQYQTFSPQQRSSK